MKTCAKLLLPEVITKHFIGNFVAELKSAKNKKASLRTGQPL